LRGTTSEFAEGTKIYTCHIESVHESGTAKAVGLREGDQVSTNIILMYIRVYVH
jgi:hypothetical protein